MLLCVIQQLGTRASARLRTSVEASFQDCIASLAGACVPTVFRFSSSTKLRDCALRPIDRIWMDITAAVPRTWLDLAVAGGGTCRRVGLGGWVAGWGGGAGGTCRQPRRMAAGMFLDCLPALYPHGPSLDPQQLPQCPLVMPAAS